MMNCGEQPLNDRALSELLIERIHQRAGGRVHVRELDVQRGQGSVIVRGRADSFYAWQLAVAACREVLPCDRLLTLDCHLEVDYQQPVRRRLDGEQP